MLPSQLLAGDRGGQAPGSQAVQFSLILPILHHNAILIRRQILKRTNPVVWRKHPQSTLRPHSHLSVNLGSAV